MQVSVITSVVAGETTVKTEAVEAFIKALSDQLGEKFTISLDADYGQSLTDQTADVYLVYFGAQANLTPQQRSQMIMFFSDDDINNQAIGRFVDMLQQLDKH
ncbi:hypothetical protein [Lactiplantibacillus modestisalitolerans]|uniref:Uncharacterized protein n=1 Tax=Lactiplantibacillus modestisalitolerans TaxID=1457219 RepID=A0ABV5WR21_9LACO|nr:hypothetical protein [Lactiplantibacillus modestisalitolerans]